MVAVNLSQFKFLNNIRIDGGYFQKDFSVIKVYGKDAQAYLQRQTTNDTNSLESGKSQLNCLLDIGSRLVSYFCLYQFSETEFLLFLEPSILESSYERLQKFVIMEEVECEQIKSFPVQVIIGEKSIIESKKKFIPDNLIETTYFGDNTVFLLSEENLDSYLSPINDIQSYIRSNLFPIDVNGVIGQLFTNTIFSKTSLSLSKGCYLGQEAVNKVISNKGFNRLPALIIAKKVTESQLIKNIAQICDYGLYIGFLSRELHLENKKFTDADGNEFEVLTNSLFDNSLERKSSELYDLAMDLFVQNKEEEAISLLERCIELNPAFIDAYESLGVIFGRLKEFHRAINIMQKLVKINPNMAMAHTNLSLFYMNIGNIDEAEKEKATALSIELGFNDNDTQRDMDELNRKEAMFKEVLNIDQQDALANYGLGEICFEKKEFSKAIIHFEIVLDEDAKYSVAYLALSKSLIAIESTVKAKDILNKGIAVATKNGDMMPANQMQYLLNGLNQK
ncbi:MAG: tetratricopeptide (TPR) repeat protein [Thermoproteota archaeon]